MPDDVAEILQMLRARIEAFDRAAREEAAANHYWGAGLAQHDADLLIAISTEIENTWMHKVDH